MPATEQQIIKTVYSFRNCNPIEIRQMQINSFDLAELRLQFKQINKYPLALHRINGIELIENRYLPKCVAALIGPDQQVLSLVRLCRAGSE